MSANGASRQRDGVSLQTLVIAAAASGAAAIVTSHFWHGGTIFTAAITPVIVSLVKEGIQRPMESDAVRRPVQRLSESRTARRSRVYAPATPGAPFEEPRPRAGAEPRRRLESDHPTMGPVQTYGRPRARRRWHVRAAIVTGVIAFAIAAIVLTLPELVFGGSVAGHGGTTFFSTQASKSSGATKGKSKQDNTSTNDSSGKGKTDTTQTAPPSQQPQGGQSTAPQPSQGAPPGGTTAPQQAPAPSTPPTSTTP